MRLQDRVQSNEYTFRSNMQSQKHIRFYRDRKECRQDRNQRSLYSKLLFFRLQIDFDAFSCKVICPHPVHRFCRILRRNLVDFTVNCANGDIDLLSCRESVALTRNLARNVTPVPIGSSVPRCPTFCFSPLALRKIPRTFTTTSLEVIPEGLLMLTKPFILLLI